MFLMYTTVCKDVRTRNSCLSHAERVVNVVVVVILKKKRKVVVVVVVVVTDVDCVHVSCNVLQRRVVICVDYQYQDVLLFVRTKIVRYLGI